MKTEVKAVIASVVVIALCLTAVGGVTYSWFSDSEQADIDITTGQIDLNVNVSDVKIQSFGFDAIDVTTENTSVTTSLGGSVKYSESSTDSQTAITITFSNAAPGDSLTFSYYAELTNTINVYYSEKSEVTDSSGSSLPSPFTISGLSESSRLYNAVTGENTNSIYSEEEKNQVTVSMNTDAGNEYMGKTYIVTILFQAHQANAPVTDSVSTTITTGQNNIKIYPTRENNSLTNVSSSINFESSGESATLTVSSMNTIDADYSVNSTSILAGINVTSSTGSSALQGTEVTVTFIIEGDLSGQTLTIYHNGVEFIPDKSPVTTYDPSSDTTTFSFVTDDGFSTYYVTTNYDAKIGSDYYQSLLSAISDVEEGETIDLLSNAIVNWCSVSNRDFTLNMNGHTISTTSFETFIFGGSNVTVNGGKFVSETDYNPIVVHNESNVIFNNTTFECNKEISVGKDVSDGSTYNFSDSLTLNNVTFTATGEYNCVTAYKNSSVIVNGGVFTSAAGGAFCTNGTDGNSIVSWTVDGATFNVSVGDNRGNDTNVIGVGIQCHNEGTWTISNCTFNMDNGVAISTRGGDVTISNCVYNYTNEFDNRTTGVLQYTSTTIDVTTPHAVATSYVEGSYGYDGSNAYLTIDGERITLIENKVEYYDFGTPTA